MAIIYCLCEPKAPNEPRYVGSTSGSIETRYSLHIRQRNWIARFNRALSEWLRETRPTIEVLAEVPESERFAAEAEYTRKLRADHDLLNVLDGQRHTEESRKRMRAGHARARAARAIAD